MCVEMDNVSLNNKDEIRESSSVIRKRIVKTRQVQEERYRDEEFHLNSQLKGKKLKKYCYLGKAEQELFDELCQNLGLSARAVERMIRVARTIADMDQSDAINENHLLEASLYKMINKKYWN